MPSIVTQNIIYAGCHNQLHYAACRYAACRYTECRYAACRYAECRGANCMINFPVSIIVSILMPVHYSLSFVLYTF
jgi:hypothetical protein